MMTKGIFSRALLALTLAVPAVSLSACGDGGGDTTTGTGTGSNDTGSNDTSSNDTGSNGTGTTDSGSTDSGSTDSGNTDSGNTDSDSSNTDAAKGLAEIAKDNPDLSKFVELVLKADLVGELAAATAENPLTVFAPTNVALDTPENKAIVDALSKEELQAALRHHVIDGAIKSTDLSGTKKVETKAGTSLIIEASTDGVKVGVAKVVKADQIATNGVIHSVDKLILAPTKKVGEVVAETPELSKLLQALKDAELEDTLNGQGPFTLFAPTNAAIEAATDFPTAKADLETLLKYHVVSGEEKYSFDLKNDDKLKSFEGKDITITVANGEVKIGESKVTSKDIMTTNGVIHLVDKVFVIPSL